MLSPSQVAARVRRLRGAATERDGAMQRVLSVREGHLADVYPQAFSDDYPEALVANFVDVASRDLSELIAPLPTLLVSSGTGLSDSAKAKASRKTNIGLWYWHSSLLQEQQFAACDRYLSYGFLPYVVECDYNEGTPKIYAEDPVGCYPLYDRLGQCVSMGRVYQMRAEELAAIWPDYENAIMKDPGDQNPFSTRVNAADKMLTVVRYYDADQTLMYLPERGNLVLGEPVPQPLGKCPVVVVRRPSIGLHTRGQFDDAIPVQMARAKMALLGIEAAEKSVQAPLAIPDDTVEVAFGADAVMRSRTPEKIRRVGLELPPGAFQESQLLDAELRMGTRYPEGRSGQAEASVITGRGIQALMGTLDTQVKTAQEMFARGLAKATALAYELDEKTWPNRSRTVRAVFEGQAFEETYKPSRDIGGDYRVDCAYGFAAGLAPNQAVVMIEQLRADKLIPRSVARKHLPLGEDVLKLERDVAVEEVRDGLMQGLTAMAQSSNVMIEQGGDPSALLSKIAQIIDGLEKGHDVEKVVTTVFAPPPQQASPPGPDDEAAETGQGAQPGESGAPPGMNDLTGLPMGTAEAGQGQGGRPPLQSLMAGLSPSGKANLQDNIAQRIPA